MTGVLIKKGTLDKSTDAYKSKAMQKHKDSGNYKTIIFATYKKLGERHWMSLRWNQPNHGMNMVS